MEERAPKGSIMGDWNDPKGGAESSSSALTAPPKRPAAIHSAGAQLSAESSFDRTVALFEAAVAKGANQR